MHSTVTIHINRRLYSITSTIKNIYYENFKQQSINKHSNWN